MVSRLRRLPCNSSYNPFPRTTSLRSGVVLRRRPKGFRPPTDLLLVVLLHSANMLIVRQQVIHGLAPQPHGRLRGPLPGRPAGLGKGWPVDGVDVVGDAGQRGRLHVGNHGLQVGDDDGRVEGHLADAAIELELRLADDAVLLAVEQRHHVAAHLRGVRPVRRQLRLEPLDRVGGRGGVAAEVDGVGHEDGGRQAGEHWGQAGGRR